MLITFGFDVVSTREHLLVLLSQGCKTLFLRLTFDEWTDLRAKALIGIGERSVTIAPSVGQLRHAENYVHQLTAVRYDAAAGIRLINNGLTGSYLQRHRICNEHYGSSSPPLHGQEPQIGCSASSSSYITRKRAIYKSEFTGSRSNCGEERLSNKLFLNALVEDVTPR